MKEFVYGSMEQFNALDQELSSGRNYKFADRQMPEACTPKTACLWFTKQEGLYHVYIDKGITAQRGSDEFKTFLERGEATFVSLDAMVSFFHSLNPLFENVSSGPLYSPTDTGRAPDGISAAGSGTSGSHVVDRQRLNEICAEQGKSKVSWPEEISEPLKRKVFGQDEVLEELADKVVINQLRSDKKLLVITLLGPTATGKSETAKSLAKVMSDVYGKKYGYIEIAGSEFIGEHTVHRFFGAPPGYVGHGESTLLAPVRRNPYHVIVINEIEKADDKILVGLMEAIDTGLLGMADNSKPINLNRCILLFTSNIPIDMEKYKAASAFERSEMCRDVFTRHCGRPEISGKIGNYLVFSPLSEAAMTDIIIKFIREELDSYNLVLAHVDEYLMADFLKHRTKYGARGIRGMVSDSVGRHLLKTRSIAALSGKSVSLSGTIDNIEFKVEQEAS